MVKTTRKKILDDPLTSLNNNLNVNHSDDSTKARITRFYTMTQNHACTNIASQDSSKVFAKTQQTCC